jgi:hypothetical protein
LPSFAVKPFGRQTTADEIGWENAPSFAVILKLMEKRAVMGRLFKDDLEDLPSCAVISERP